ncbi:SPV105 putative myristylated membrane protein [Swinepox virus]|uniref:SPV105 putative myristylated membrane protein n=1 Tax=Swinepox virus (strain Swine/Nebraska/17077-99/1999) TaxID=300880 RepID=Q8V3J1_SWPV1|nr:SPV105 putative myristylated membrane protein [Swinepox virus]AAL69844.1 SPV105 putative myristylated membrane protein [Swinepox virus]UED36575.1 SPV105 putative myristylated membrane protein [Swinepox virus]UED36724.1 SPV105 putative myristylated membrane protein [Swinepox virus]UUA44295.1 SPV105 [Swinepox virus]
MGSYLSITNLKVEKDPVNYNKKYMFISFNYPEYDKTIGFYEELDTYTDENVNDINPKFCLTDNIDVSYCGTFLSNDLAKKYVLTKGNSCRSFTFRPGSMIIYDNDITEDYIDNKLPDAAKEYISKGFQCRFIKKDYMVMDNKLGECCSKPSDICPEILNNGYKTNHCDTFMVNFCKTNPDNSQCLIWLRQKRQIALSTYLDICSENMDQRYCSEFIRVVRPDFYTFGDAALINFCNKFKGNRNCWCVFPPNQTITSEKYLGPRVCYLHECTDRTRDRKWLLYDQDIQRSRCKYTGCNININSLILENSKVDLISNCGYKNINRDSDPGEPKNTSKYNNIQTPNILEAVIIFIGISILFYCISVYHRKKINTNIINVRRR